MSEHFFCSSLSNIKSSDWNECVGNDHPFLQYEFLYALEKSNSANTKTGWQPYHYIEQENDKIISLCPLYIKNHSFGEYIFDHSWADAYHRYGINYYPKLQSAIPFTPVTGDRIVLNKSVKDKKGKQVQVVNNIIEEAKGYQRLIQEFGYDHEKISKFMSKSRSHISNTLRLLNLPEDIIGLLEEEKLTAGQARPLIGLPNASEIAENIVKKKVAAREVETLVKNKKTKSKSNIEDPNIQFIKNEIESKLGLSIEIVNKKNNSGKVVIKYKSLDQFELISKKLRK